MTVTPCDPTSAAAVVLRPLGIDEVTLRGGFWGRWQDDNREVGLPHALAWLERDGAVENLRRVAPEASLPGPRRGMRFSDSDVHKTLEALGWDLGRGAAPAMSAAADELVAVLRAAQRPDGYLNSWVQAGMAQPYADLAEGHELYCYGHLLQAAVAHARATGRDGLLDVARRAADHLVEVFGDLRRPDTDGHPEIETALVELYRLTSEEAYLRLATQLLDVRGHGVLGPGAFGSTYFQDDVPVRDQVTVAGHAVRQLYLMAGALDVAAETVDGDLLAAVQRQWAAMTTGHEYVTGALGSRFEGEAFGDAYELPPDLVYGETCATIAAVMTGWRLLLATGEGRYADVLDRMLHNLFAASTSTDRTGFFYVNPEQRRRPRAAAPVDGKALRSDAPGTRPAWFDCACCPPNIMRLVASLGCYLATTDASGVQLHLYTPATVRAQLAGGAVRLDVETRYPDEDGVTVTVGQAPRGVWTLSLRVPAWCEGAQVTVNGEPPAGGLHGPADRSGYARLSREWAAGDVVRLDLLMPVRLVHPHPAVDALRGQVAVLRGPVVHCLESVDQPQVDLDRVELDPSQPLVAAWDGELPGGGATVVRGRGRVRDDSAWAGRSWDAVGGIPAVGARTPPSGAPEPADVPLTLVPYRLWANRGPCAMRVWVPIAAEL